MMDASTLQSCLVSTGECSGQPVVTQTMGVRTANNDVSRDTDHRQGSICNFLHA